MKRIAATKKTRGAPILHPTSAARESATRHVALGRKMLVEAVKQLLDHPGLGQLLA